MVNEVNPRLNCDAHSLLQHTCCPQRLQTWLIDTLHSLGKGWDITSITTSKSLDLAVLSLSLSLSPSLSPSLLLSLLLSLPLSFCLSLSPSLSLSSSLSLSPSLSPPPHLRVSSYIMHIKSHEVSEAMGHEHGPKTHLHHLIHLPTHQPSIF